ncbi:MAG: hypothetical protein KF721_14095 [Ignavibacteriaceae bacterium]|nr:hypothetical protein [Ignavibacteriaceae bacterium]
MRQSKNYRSVSNIQKRFSELREGLIKFGDNSDLHSALSQKELEDFEKAFNDLVKEHKEALVRARVLYKQLETEVKNSLVTIAKYERIIRAKLGIKDRSLMYFGLSPYRDYRKSSSSTDETTSTMQNPTQPE